MSSERLLGELTSQLDAFIVEFTSLAFVFSGFSVVKTFVLALLSGFLGLTLDRVLRAMIQVHYKCPICGKTIEKKNYCEETVALIKG